MKRFSFKKSSVPQWLKIIQGCLDACIKHLKTEEEKLWLVCIREVL